MLSSLRKGLPRRAKPIRGSASACASIDINAAFDFVASDYFERCRLWQPQIIELRPLGDPSMRPGARARQTTFDRGMRSEWLFEIDEIDPPHRFSLTGLSEPIRFFYEFEGADRAGTELTFGYEAALTLPMRPFAASIQASLQQGAEQTVANLKRVLEAQAEPATTVTDIWQAARNPALARILAAH